MPQYTPALSVILPVTGRHRVRDILAYLRRQSVVERLELVLVVREYEDDPLDPEEGQPFAACRVVRADFATRAHANAAGITVATAPVVAVAEEHTFPAPDWAEALLRRHQEPWAAVGAVIGNANPRTRTSCANLLLDYAPWLEPHQGGEATHLPGHNTSYKRPVLLRYAERLPFLLEIEDLLHDQLRRDGERLYLEPLARVAHVNISRLVAFLQALALGGRSYGAARAASWSRRRRLVYALGSPLIPLVRLRHIARDWRGPRSALARCMPVLLLGLAADALGQASGYALGQPVDDARLTRFDFSRAEDITAAERSALFPALARGATRCSN